MKAGQLSRHSCNQIPRGRYQHTGVQAGPEHKQDHSRGRDGRKERDRNHNKGGQTTRETPGPAQAQRGAQKSRKTASPQEHKDNTITRAPQGNTCKKAKDRQGEGGQHRQSKLTAKCAGPEYGTKRDKDRRGGGACSGTRQETAKRIRAVRVHLSCLRTDTQVQKKLSSKHTLG